MSRAAPTLATPIRAPVRAPRRGSHPRRARRRASRAFVADGGADDAPERARSPVPPHPAAGALTRRRALAAALGAATGTPPRARAATPRDAMTPARVLPPPSGRERFGV